MEIVVNPLVETLHFNTQYRVNANHISRNAFVNCMSSCILVMKRYTTCALSLVEDFCHIRDAV